MDKWTAEESGFACGSSVGILSKLSLCLSRGRAPWKVMLRGTRKVWKAFCPLLFLNVEGSSSVFCSWLVVLWSSCGLAWVGLVESSAGFLFTELLTQADDTFPRKSSCVFQVPVFPYVTLLMEQQSCPFVTQYFLFGVSLHAEPLLPLHLPGSSIAKNTCVCCASDQH